jgi:hypothetical protein
MRSDIDNDGYLDWSERQRILSELTEGMGNDSPEIFRRRIYYHVSDHLEQAGLKPPIVNTDISRRSSDDQRFGLRCVRHGRLLGTRILHVI